MSNLAHIMSRLVNVPLLVHPGAAIAIYNFLATRTGYGPLEMPAVPSASRFAGEWAPDADGGRNWDGSPKVEPFRLTKDGIGIVTVTGELVNRGAWVGANSGLTSYEGIKHQLARAGNDSRVNSIILDLDSPGGEGVGFTEAAAAVRQVAARKPVVAIANGIAASAAYGFASGASRMIATPSALVGSIGTVFLHLDLSGQLNKKGIRPTLIFAGAHKVDANPLEPLSDAGSETIQAEVNKFYSLLVEAVATGRGRRTPASAARATEARVYVGKDAVEARLADDIGSFEDVLDELTRRARRSAGGTKSKTISRSERRHGMSEEGREVFGTAENGPEMVGMSPHELEARLAAARRDGAKTMIDRFKAIAADERIKGKEPFAFRLACEAPEMPAESVGAMCENVPAATAPSPIPTIEQRSRMTGADGISSHPETARSAHAQGWDNAVQKVNQTVRRAQH